MDVLALVVQKNLATTYCDGRAIDTRKRYADGF